MHDLMHDLAQEVAGNEWLMLSSKAHFNRKLRHLSIWKGHDLDLFSQNESLARMKAMRTLIQIEKVPQLVIRQSVVPMILSNCRCVRVLDLRGCLDKTLPSTIGKLIHLRYLDVSYNYNLELLPESITKLHNLQFLGLVSCTIGV